MRVGLTITLNDTKRQETNYIYFLILTQYVDVKLLYK